MFNDKLDISQIISLFCNNLICKQHACTVHHTEGELS
jgi:hypothetical protein